MRPSQIENWALQLIERVERKQPIEDSRVELKSEWIEYQKGARRLAGHANAARGENILWLIGLDEEKGISGVEKEELPVWINKVQSYFDGIFPSPQDIAIPINGKTVVALLFETDRAPFVIKVPEHGRAKGVPSHEVPWREGTQVRTANRSDLIKILVPIIHEPIIEILDGSMRLHEWQGNYSWRFSLQIYITPDIGKSFAIPFHKCNVSFENEAIQPLTAMNNISLRPPYRTVPGIYTGGFYSIPKEPDSNTIISTKEDVFITGPGRINIEAEYIGLNNPTPLTDIIKRDKLKIFILMVPTYLEKNISLDVQMQWREDNDENNLSGKWIAVK